MQRLWFRLPTEMNQSRCIPTPKPFWKGFEGRNRPLIFGFLGVAPQGSETQTIAKTKGRLIDVRVCVYTAAQRRLCTHKWGCLRLSPLRPSKSPILLSITHKSLNPMLCLPSRIRLGLSRSRFSVHFGLNRRTELRVFCFSRFHWQKWATSWVACGV
jgi:hypothetical protein